MSRRFPFLKGHGTENDFIVLPDPEGVLHGDLDPELVRALCDRRAGLGADGVLRAVHRDGIWFMDYRNSDGSVSEMCGNGIRVFARYLMEHEGMGNRHLIPIATRAGVKNITPEADGSITVNMGIPEVLGETKVSANGHTWAATHVSMGNPHAVAFVDSLDEPGPLTEAPEHDAAVYPEGVNVEFVVRRGEGHIAMRVHERGSGETRSCGTGACAAMVATELADGMPIRPEGYRVDVPGGRLNVTREGGHILLNGPAVLVAEGIWVAGR
ncbi:MAG TPA: diaminopimelate epimerase [Nocardioidaceae bacterium]|nr:diaminopimelate epimerase [Nocardioidaceae bacterium]